jgi:HD-like signal output (HDOD) protein
MVLSSNPRFDELKTTGKLPSPSGVALAIIELCRRDSVNMDEIAHAVRADPALSGRVIKFANAAVHGPRRPVVSVIEAIKLVGVSTVRQLVLGFSLLGQYRAGAGSPMAWMAATARYRAIDHLRSRGVETVITGDPKQHSSRELFESIRNRLGKQP